MTSEKWQDPPDWAIGDWSLINPTLMRKYSEGFLNYVSEKSGGQRYDAWAMAEIARRRSVELHGEVALLNASSKRMESLTATLKWFTVVLIVFALIQIGIAAVQTWKMFQPERKPEIVLAQPAQPTEADNWQRTKDCSAHVDAMKGEKDTPILQYGRVAHYSRRYGRCFLEVKFTALRPLGKGDRTNSLMLMDAFEGSIGAMVPFTPPCYLGGKQEDCVKAEAFIDDAMTN